ncbi:MAG: rod shape-determining protein RodA [Omnitrophica bacterium RBG_13_46_9]|nr:MAG: rod shape-determining protein RodA [Omnitrophica bacterium RBG_13_46_9]
MGFTRDNSKNFDKIIFFSTLAILFVGVLVLHSASSRYYHQNIVFRQIIWISVGIMFLFAVLRISYQKILHVSYLLYGLNMFFLVLVLVIGQARGGSHRWINLGAFNFQPSELAKIALIFALSSYLGARKGDVARIGALFGVLCFALPVFILILIEPDLGTALMLVPITFAMLFMAGANMRHLMSVVFMGLGALPFLWHLLRDYQKQRLLVFINPNIDPLGSGYTIIQSKIAVGSGGLFGKGWLSGTQNQLNFLPERHTDFIFSVVGEEWGFLGALILILLYLLIVYRGIKIMQSTPDIYGRLIATGVVTLFSLQVVINIGMTIGFLPVVGITLPLISYGGSSLITTLILIGVLLNIGMRRPLF